MSGSVRGLRLVLGLACALAVTLPRLGLAQLSLVADIGDAVVEQTADFFGGLPETVTMGGVGYFLYDDGIHGRELWRTDGTTAGTALVADLCPGSCGAAWLDSDRGIAATADVVFFAGNDGVHGEELWVSDGTEAGTRMVRDLAAGLRSSGPGDLTEVGNRAFFTAEDEVHGREIWVSDGTAAGTALVADLTDGANSTRIDAAAALGDLLLFGRNSYQSAGGLWRSDGTADGTYRLTDAQPAQQSWTEGASFRALGGRLLFWADDADGVYDPTLWVSDSTVAGTGELAPIAEPTGFVVQGGLLFFSGSEGSVPGLYKSDGTPAGTVAIPLPPGTEPTPNYGFQAAGSTLVFFGARDAAHGQELWATDGTSAWLVNDIWPGPDWGLQVVFGNGFATWVPGLATAGDRVVFFADDGVSGREPWGSDGTEAGTQLLVDLTPGPAGTAADNGEGLPPRPTVGGAVLFRTADLATGRQLWRSEGTPATTSLVAALRTQTSAVVPTVPGLGPFGGQPFDECFAPVGAGLIFSPYASTFGAEPWFSDGTSGGTYPITDLYPGVGSSGPAPCRPLASGVVFQGTGPGGVFALYSSSGAPGDVIELTGPLSAGAYGLGTAYLGGTLYGSQWDSLWRTDGTIPGTEIIAAPFQVFPTEAETFGDRVYIGSDELYSVADGSADVTLVADLNGASWSYPERLTAFGPLLLFFASEDATGRELWASDGTAEGTTLVRDIRPGSASGISEERWGIEQSFITRLAPLGDRAVFAADDGLHGEELWVTDGTESGTQLLADLYPGTYPSSPRELTRVGNWVYFVAEQPGVGRELLRTNGLPGGTQLVADLVAGPGSSLPQQLTAAGSELYFSAWTPGSGREPWRLRDGAAAGGFLAPLTDIAPGPLSSSPLAFLEIGGTVFLVANDNTLGFELWTVRESDAVFSDGFESSGTAVWGATEP